MQYESPITSVKKVMAKIKVIQKEVKLQGKKSRCVCETLQYAPAATKSKKLFLASRSKSRSQGH